MRVICGCSHPGFATRSIPTSLSETHASVSRFAAPLCIGACLCPANPPAIGVDPVSWTPDPLGRRYPPCRNRDRLPFPQSLPWQAVCRGAGSSRTRREDRAGAPRRAALPRIAPTAASAGADVDHVAGPELDSGLLGLQLPGAPPARTQGVAVGQGVVSAVHAAGGGTSRRPRRYCRPPAPRSPAPTPARIPARRGSGRRRRCRGAARGGGRTAGKRTSATSTLPNLMPPAVCHSPPAGQPSPGRGGAAARTGVEHVPDERPAVAGISVPWIAMRKRRPQPAMTRSGQAGSNARMIASMISCAQWAGRQRHRRPPRAPRPRCPPWRRLRADETCRRSSACPDR